MSNNEITRSAKNAVTTAKTAIKEHDDLLAAQWAAAPNPWSAIAQRSSPEVRAHRAKLFAALDAAKELTRTQSKGPSKVLNAAGKRQASLDRALTNQITLPPKMTVEQDAAGAIRRSQFDRTTKAKRRAARKA